MPHLSPEAIGDALAPDPRQTIVGSVGYEISNPRRRTRPGCKAHPVRVAARGVPQLEDAYIRSTRRRRPVCVPTHESTCIVHAARLRRVASITGRPVARRSGRAHRYRHAHQAPHKKQRQYRHFREQLHWNHPFQRSMYACMDLYMRIHSLFQIINVVKTVVQY